MAIKVANPAPAAPIFKPKGRIKNGSRMIFSRQPLIAPILAIIERPSARRIKLNRIFIMPGTAPRQTVQNIYCFVTS